MSMNKKKIIKRLLIGLIIWIAYMFIHSAPPPSKNKFQSDSASTQQSDEIAVAVTREITDQLTEQNLTDPFIVEATENHLLELLKKKMNGAGTEAFYEAGGVGEFNPSYSSESWSLIVDGRNFVIVRIDVNGMLQCTTIIGIQGNELIKVSGLRKGQKLVPHMHGKCVEKVEEIFGVDFIDF